MFRLIGFDLHVRVALDKWPFVKIWFGKVWKVPPGKVGDVSHKGGTKHKIFNG